MYMDSLHIQQAINVDSSAFLQFNNWLELKLANAKNKLAEEVLHKFKTQYNNLIDNVVDFCLSNLVLYIDSDDGLNIEDYVLLEKNTAKLLIIAQNSLINNKVTSVKLISSCSKLLEFFCKNRKCITKNAVFLVSNKLFEIERRVLEQTLKSLPYLIANSRDDNDTLHREILEVLHLLLKQSFSSQIILTIVDNLLAIQCIIYGNKLSAYLIARFNKVDYDDSFMNPECKIFYDSLFELCGLDIVKIGIARGIINMDYNLVNHGQDILFLGFNSGVSMELTQISLIGMQMYVFAVFYKYRDELDDILASNDCFEFIYRIKKLFDVLVKVWGSRARRSSHLSICLWENLVKALIGTKNLELLKVASEASNNALKQFYHRKRLYYTCLDLSIPILGIRDFINGNPQLILQLIILTGELNSRTIAIKLLRKVFRQIIKEVEIIRFKEIFYPLIANLVKNESLVYNGVSFGGDLSEFSQSSIANAILTLLADFDNIPDLTLLKYMNTPSRNKLVKSKYGLVIESTDSDSEIDKIEDANKGIVYITNELCIAETIILSWSRKRNRITFSQSESFFDSAIIISCEESNLSFHISLSRIIVGILNVKEPVRVNILQALTIAPKMVQPTLVESWLILLAANTSFTITCLENRQLQLATFVKFFQRFKNPVKQPYLESVVEPYSASNDDLYSQVKLLRVIQNLDVRIQFGNKLFGEMNGWFICRLDEIMAREFFIGANYERLDMALKISKEFITVLSEEYISFSRFRIVKSILFMFLRLPEQLVGLGFDIIKVMPSDIISANLEECGILLNMDKLIDDVRPSVYTQSAYLYLLLSIKCPRLIELSNPIDNPESRGNHLDLFFDRSMHLVDLHIDFLVKYFQGDIKGEISIPLASGSLYVFSRMVNYYYKAELDVCKYMKVLRKKLFELGNFIVEMMIKNPNYFDCRGHLSSILFGGDSMTTKVYDYEDLGKFKFGLFGPKRYLKSVKGTFSEFVTSTIWKNISALTNALISLINYTFGFPCKKTNKSHPISPKPVTEELLCEVYKTGDLIITLLLCSKHRGSIDAYSNFLNTTIAKLKMSGYETQKIIEKWIQRVILLFKGEDFGNFSGQLSFFMLSRSENIAICLVSLLSGNSKIEDKNLGLVIQSLISERVNRQGAMHLLLAIVRSSNLAYFLNNYIHEILYLALENVSSDDWSVSNAASLLFSCCINYLASGSSDDLLEDSFYTRHLNDLFQCKCELKSLVVKSLSDWEFSADMKSDLCGRIRQTAFSLMLVIKFNGGEEFLAQIQKLLGFSDSRIRNLAVKGAVKYSGGIESINYYLSRANEEYRNSNLLHGLLSVANKLEVENIGSGIEDKILELFRVGVPAPILPILLELGYKFLSFKLDLGEYKHVIELVTSAFGIEFFREMQQFFRIQGTFVEIPCIFGIQSMCLRVLIKLSQVLKLCDRLEFRNKFHKLLLGESLDLSFFDEKWHILGPKLLENRCDESCLEFCLRTCYNDPKSYISVLTRLLSTRKFISVECLALIAQLTLTVVHYASDGSADLLDGWNELLEYSMGMVQAVTSDMAKETVKLSVLRTLSVIKLRRPSKGFDVVSRYNNHLWSRLIYILQDESHEVRQAASSIVCDSLHIWGLCQKMALEWASTENLAQSLLDVSTRNDNNSVCDTVQIEEAFVVFAIEPANIYREDKRLPI